MITTANHHIHPDDKPPTARIHDTFVAVEFGMSYLFFHDADHARRWLDDALDAIHDAEKAKAKADSWLDDALDAIHAEKAKAKAAHPAGEAIAEARHDAEHHDAPGEPDRRIPAADMSTILRTRAAS